MIYKSYLIEKNINSLKENLVLFYGENFGIKKDFREKNFTFKIYGTTCKSHIRYLKILIFNMFSYVRARVLLKL